MNHPLRTGALALVLALPAAAALAGGGPRNVLIVVNERAEESLEIGQAYARARGISPAQICRLDTSTAFTVSKDVYQTEIEAEVQACIAAAPDPDRIDYLVLTRGLPIRANFPDDSAPPTKPVSITELLRVMDTPLRGKNQEYGPPYRFQFYPNPYQGRRESHEHSKSFGGYNLFIATMLSGYWSEHARALIDRSLASDLSPPHEAGGTFYLEEASGAAGTRNDQIPSAVASLEGRGIPAQAVFLADPDVTDSVVASHLSGGSYSSISRAEIRSNSYPPGALVCALESFGLVPNNFNPDANPSQVPVTWWIEAGATGGHGTVAEPYNVAFPGAFLFDPWVDGFNLGETYYQGIPYLYWMNMVLGDPLAAPYAIPPTVTIVTPAGGDVLAGQVRFEATATTPKPEGIRQMEFFVDDTLVHAEPDGAGWVRFDTAAFADGAHRLEVVAYENTILDTQGFASIEVVFDNSGLQLDITDPAPGTIVSGVFDVTVDGSAGLNAVSLSALGTELGTASGPPPWTIPVDSALLGRGLVTLRAEATDGANGVRSAGVDVQVAKAPRVHRIDPVFGPESGGTAVTITGWNFEPGTRVWFGANEAVVDSRDDANHLQVTTPPGPVGPVDVRIESLGLEVIEPGGFTYLVDCTEDADGDLICDDADNCLDTPNTDQADGDGDLCGDACDPDPGDPAVNCDTPDGDGDGVVDPLDNCPGTANPGQEDEDGDLCGDACDPQPADPTVGCEEPDRDGDGVPDATDNCPDTPNPTQTDTDLDGIGDACEGCAATEGVLDLRVTRVDPATVALSWSPTADACAAGYAVFALTDLPASEPFVEITDRDTDGDPGGDPAFTGAPDAGTLTFLSVFVRGSDGGLGP